MIFYNATAKRFNIKTFIDEDIRFMHKNCKVAFLSHPMGELGVMYTRYMYLVGKRDRLPIGDN